MPKIRFPRTARVRAKSDFDRIFKHGRRVALPVLALHWQVCPQQPDSGPRLGLAVSRKVDPHAVGRNRIKRVLRETFRACRADLADGDYVLVARVGAARCDHQQLQAAFLGLLRRSGALPIDAMAARGSASAPLPAPGADGTMPPSRRSDVPSSTDPTPPSGGG
ncbi:ribonuclease P protein component [Lysobacter sp. A286]